MEEIGKQNIKSLRSIKSMVKKGVKGSYKTRVKAQEKLIRKLENKGLGLERKKLAACSKTKAAKAEQKNLDAIKKAKQELERLEGEKALELVEDEKKAEAKAAKKAEKEAKKAAKKKAKEDAKAAKAAAKAAEGFMEVQLKL